MNKSLIYAVLGFTGGIFASGIPMDQKYQEEKAKREELEAKLADASSGLNHAQEQTQIAIDKATQQHLKDLQATKDALGKAEELKKQLDAVKAVIEQNEKTIKELQDKLAALPTTGEIKPEVEAEEPQKTFDATIKRPTVDPMVEGKKALGEARKALEKAYQIKNKWDTAKSHPPGSNRPKEASAQYIADLEEEVKNLEFKYGQ